MHKKKRLAVSGETFFIVSEASSITSYTKISFAVFSNKTYSTEITPTESHNNDKMLKDGNGYSVRVFFIFV